MANNNELDDLLAQVPIGDLAKQLGVDEGTALAAVKQALPGLVGGMAVNASSEEGAQALEGALSKHTPASGQISLDAIDTEDGKKIVKHVLGDKEEAVANHLGAKAGGLDIGKLIPILLPILAPIVMQFLAGRMSGASTTSKTTSKAQSQSGGGLGDILGGLLGGLGGGGSAASQGGGLDDLLGGLLGGGSGGGKSSGGGLGGLLGGLLGR